MCVSRFSARKYITHFSYLAIAYKKDGCQDDPGWCFQDAVNNSLPPSFYSYGQCQAANPAQSESCTLFSNMQLPSVTDILVSAQKYPGTPNGAWDPFAPVSQTYTGGEWASSGNVEDAGFKRNASPGQLHEAMYLADRDSFDGMDVTPTQRCIAKGYSDGFLTAKIFASYNTSRLGFKGQYIEDSICALGPTVVAPGTEGSYRRSFMSGLQDGEAIINATLNRP